MHWSSWLNLQKNKFYGPFFLTSTFPNDRFCTGKLDLVTSHIQVETQVPTRPRTVDAQFHHAQRSKCFDLCFDDNNTFIAAELLP